MQMLSLQKDAEKKGRKEEALPRKAEINSCKNQAHGQEKVQENQGIPQDQEEGCLGQGEEVLPLCEEEVQGDSKESEEEEEGHKEV